MSFCLSLYVLRMCFLTVSAVRCLSNFVFNFLLYFLIFAIISFGIRPLLHSSSLNDHLARLLLEVKNHGWNWMVLAPSLFQDFVRVS